jgi:hypothetical protein
MIDKVSGGFAKYQQLRREGMVEVWGGLLEVEIGSKQAVFGECNIAYQIGEATEIHSGQLFHATPHCVQVSPSCSH